MLWFSGKHTQTLLEGFRKHGSLCISNGTAGTPTQLGLRDCTSRTCSSVNYTLSTYFSLIVTEARDLHRVWQEFYLLDYSVWG